MTRKKLLNYAKSNIDESENEIKVLIDINEESMYIETVTGRTFKLHEDEIRYQAMQFLKHELEDIKIN